MRTGWPAAPASPSSRPPRSAPPGPRGCSVSPVAPMAPPAHNNLSSTQPPESGAVTSRERPSHPAGSATRVRRGVAMGTELPPRSRLWVDFRIFGVGDNFGASRPLGDNGWGPSVGVRGPFSQGTRAGVRSAERTLPLGSTGLSARTSENSAQPSPNWNSPTQEPGKPTKEGLLVPSQIPKHLNTTLLAFAGCQSCRKASE